MNHSRFCAPLICVACIVCSQGFAQPAPLKKGPVKKAPASASAPLPSARKLGQLSTSILRELLPREHKNTKKWGGTTEVFNGIRVYRDGGRIKTRRKKRTVNHGTWRMYHAKLVDPDTLLHVRIEQLEEVGPGRLGFDLVVVAKLDLFGRVVRWQKGVRVFSLSAVADAKIRLRARLELGVQLDPSHLPPDVVLDAVAKDAQVELVQFELRELSDIKGGAAHQLGKLIRELLEDELEDKRPKLVRKINDKIDKKRDRLRISLRDLILDKLLSTKENAEGQSQ